MTRFDGRFIVFKEIDRPNGAALFGLVQSSENIGQRNNAIHGHANFPQALQHRNIPSRQRHPMNPFKLAATILHLFTAIAVLELIGTEVLLTLQKRKAKLLK